MSDRMDDHPHELLAALVDGSIDADDRARVSAHVAVCSTCRTELDLATRARGSLGRLPDLPPPIGLGAKARRLAAGPRFPRWMPVAASGAAAVAAAVVALVAFLGPGTQRDALPGQGAGGGAPSPTARAPGAASEATGSGVALGPTSFDAGRLAPRSVRRLAGDLVVEARAAVRDGFPPTAIEFYAGFDITAVRPEARSAYRCVARGLRPGRALVPFRIGAARFQGHAAWAAAFLQGPRPDRPYDRVLVVVSDRRSCAVLHLAQQLY